MKLNLNIPCKAILTDSGADLWNAQYVTLPDDYRPDIVHGGSKISTQLWCIMQVFGPHIFLGMGQVHFKDNYIEIDDFDAVQP